MKNGIPHATLLLTIGLCREKQQEHPLAEFEATTISATDYNWSAQRARTTSLF